MVLGQLEKKNSPILIVNKDYKGKMAYERMMYTPLTAYLSLKIPYTGKVRHKFNPPMAKVQEIVF